jgi:serine/threonine-protein kinase
MDNTPAPKNNSLPLDVEKQVDEICDRFEKAWKQGQRPRIEDYLAALGEPGRSTLLRELIKVDIVYRRRAGEHPTAEEYRERFPNLDPPVEVSTVANATTPPDGAPDSKSIGALPSGRYQLGEELGRGGMGKVLKGRDPELDRDLAIKMLLEEHQERPEMVQRFLVEARINGRLQHPGIVPIYDLDRFPDQRPFFTMKLVQGRKLAELLAERPDPTHDLPRFLKIFEQVCQTLAYAHSKGVIHRDLKPRNIMVGEFGEVQVMDWGLAKVLPPVEEKLPLKDEAGLSPASGTGSASLSRVGQVMGTLAYMPPEQARGEIDKLDERCDVFGLGAILCVILTGKPPYRGEKGKVLNLAQQADQADALARLDSCGADADLVRLAKGCLQPQVEDRPRNAAVVAEHVTAYLVGVQERLRQAEVERAAAQAREEEARARAEAEAQALRAERRARQRTLALAASLLLLLSGVGAAGWWYQQQLAAQTLRQEQATGEVKGALREVVQLRARALTLLDNPESWKATLEAAGLAVKRAEALLQQEPQLAGTALAQEVEQSRVELEADAKDHQLVTAFEQVLFKMSEFHQQRYTKVEVYEDVQKALAQWGLRLAEVPAARATSLLQQRPREIQDRLTAILHFCLSRVPTTEKKEKKWLREVLATADPDSWRQQVRQAVGNKDAMFLEKLMDKADVAQQAPSFLVEVAHEPLLKGKPGQIALLRRAQEAHPQNFWLNFELSLVLFKSIFPGGTIRAAREEELPVVHEMIRFLTAALALRPQSPLVHNNLGLALHAQGEVKGAIACLKKVLDLDPEIAKAHNNLGLALQAQGDVKGAIACFTKALVLDPKYAPAHSNLGQALLAQGNLKGAIECFQKALILDPKLTQAHNNLGVALANQGDVKGAIACFTKALDLDPKDAGAHTNLGNALQAQGDVQGAIACFKKALALDPKYALAHSNLGAVLYAQGEVQGGIACLKKALTLDPKLVQAHYNLGLTLKDKADWKGAIACFKKALDLDPKLVQAHANLGQVLLAQGAFQEARAATQQALQLLPVSHLLRQPITQQLEACQRLLELDARLPALLTGNEQPADAAERVEFAEVCQYKRFYAASARFYKDAFAANPKLAEDPTYADRYHAACSAALAGCGEGEDAVKPDAKKRAYWRKQALTWLQADLAMWSKQLETDKPEARSRVRKTLQSWQYNLQLAGLRDEKALAKLPEAEQQACRQLWADVDKLLKRSAAEK